MSEEGLDDVTHRRVVRERYAGVATDADVNCCSDADVNACCADETTVDDTARTLGLGYSEQEVDAVAEGANLGLGCGNPTAIANLESGETVLDLGSGAGFDCFLAAREVGETGRVIGVDMTPEMVERARENVEKNDTKTVEFRLGEIEHLPVADASVDVVLSNCVINLSSDEPQVFREAYRVLRPGGRLTVSDVVSTADLPTDLREDPDLVAACVAGAAPIEELKTMLSTAGFESVTVTPKEDSEEFIREWDPEYDLEEFVVSARITGEKPATATNGGE
jgi:SAM-dependent methyltransferase